jgi:hypothetical protein
VKFTDHKLVEPERRRTAPQAAETLRPSEKRQLCSMTAAAS